MADIRFLAAGVKDAPQWTRAEGTNPTIPILRDSWKNREDVGRGKQRKPLGAAKSFDVTSWDNLRALRSSLLSGARALNLGLEIAYFGQAPIIGYVDADGEPVDGEPDPDAGDMPVYGDAPKLGTIKNEEDFRAAGGRVEMRFRTKRARQMQEVEPNGEDTDDSEDTDE